MRFVQLTLDEIDDLRASSNSVELAFLGICFGALLTLSATLATVTIESEVARVAFVVLIVMFALASAFFATKAVQAHRRWKRRFQRYEEMAQTSSE